MARGLATPVAVLIAMSICGCDPQPGDDSPQLIPLAAEATASSDRVLRLVLRITADGVATVKAIEAPGRIGRRDPYRASPTFYRGYDLDGRELFERGFRLETHLRSEIHGPGGVIEGTRVPLAEPVFTVIVTILKDLHSIRFYRTARGDTRRSAEPIGEVRP
ncbi:MAG: hypothetical protein JRF63_11175 [Deltaproteobacteria bacterium]|nr:hypothetical protein [Deltaproteobacteria bacterium]